MTAQWLSTRLTGLQLPAYGNSCLVYLLTSPITSLKRTMVMKMRSPKIFVVMVRPEVALVKAQGAAVLPMLAVFAVQEDH
jgi:hypothetical protein